MGQRKSKIAEIVAQDILCEIQNRFRDLKANSGELLFRQIRDYITETYLTPTEKDGE